MTTSNRPKTRVVIYQQLCTKEPAPKGQLAELKSYALKKGWDVVKVITDTHDPDTKSPKERTGLVQALRLAHKKQFDVLLVWSLDDLSRVGIKHTLNHLQTLRNNSVDWCFLKDPLLNSQGKQSEIVLEVLARLTESANFRKNLQIAKEYEAGKKAGKKGRVTLSKATEKTRQKVIKAKELRAKGWTFELIGAELGVSRERAYQLCQYQIREN